MRDVAPLRGYVAFATLGMCMSERRSRTIWRISDPHESGAYAVIDPSNRGAADKNENQPAIQCRVVARATV